MMQENRINSSPAAFFEETAGASIRNSVSTPSLLETLTEFARRKGLILAVTAVCMMIGVIVACLLPVRYTATTKIMPPQQTQSEAALLMMNQFSGTGSGSLSALASGGLGLKNPNDVYIGLLESRPVADAIIRDFSLRATYHSKDMTGARKALAGDTTITTEKSNMIAISVTDKDRNRAAAIANAYTSQLHAITQNLAVTEASQRRMFYEEQLKLAKDALVTADLNFQQVQQKNGLVSLDTQSKTIIESLASLRAQAAAKEVQIEALRSYSTERNPDVGLAERELDALQAQAEKLKQRDPSGNFADLGLADVPSAGRDYLEAQHELLYRQTLYDLLIKQYEAARLDEAKEGAVIQIVEPAIPPDLKSSPHRAQISLLFALVGLMGACIYVILGDLARRNLEFSRSLNELKSALISRPAHRKTVRDRTVSA